jgi:hypothetical protein
MAKNNNPGRILKGTKATATLKGASGIWTMDEAMQLHRANAWPQPDLFQPVANSLRLKGAATASYAIRSVSRPGSTTAGTISFWTKLGYSASDQHFFQSVDALGGSSSANRLYMAFSSAGTLYVYGLDGNANNTEYFVTSQLFRDYSAWYHIVVAIDSTQTTQANRFKLYANGVQVTAFSTATYPSQGAGIPFSLNATTFIGCNRGAGLSYAGEMAEFNFVDGYAVDPSLFGKLDSNNTWVPIAYTGSYGTNGFYLPFNNAATSQTLGYDASVNGTTTYDADQDPYRGNVALHLTGNGPAGGNNNTFADSGPNNYAVTRNGTVTQGSFSPFPMQANAPYNSAQHGASMYQTEVASDFPSFPTGSQGSNFTFAGDFTIEGWVYYTSSSGDTSFYVISDGTNYLAFNISMSAGVFNIYLNSGSPTSSPSHGMAINTWNHVAMVRSGSTVTLYANGVSKGTISNSSTLGFTSPTINRCGGGVGGVSRYVSSFRIVKAAVYTTAFTPTNRPFGTLTNNLLTFSEDFRSYSLAQSSITASAAIAPDGTPSASKLVEAAGASTHYMDLNARSYTASTAYTYSIYVKAAERTSVMIFFYGDNAVFANKSVHVNLTTGTIAYTGAGITSSIQNVGNGWYRIIATGTAAASATGYIGLYLSTAPGSSDGTVSYTGNGVSGVYVWGAQLEAASSVGNYTPTPANYSTAPSLLLNFANAAVVDSAGANNITTVGSATITSASKYGSGALAFSGSTSNYFLTNPGSQFEPGSQDFTVEFWWYPISTGRQWFYHATTDYWFAVDYSSVSTNQKMGMWASSNGSSWNMINSDSGGNGICNTVVPQNQWNHIAYTRNNTTFRLFLNGKLDGIVSASGSIVDRSSQAKYIGTWAGAGGGAPAVNGSIDDFRFTKGIARYTSDFTPPARALPETGGKSFVTNNINAGVVRRFTTTGTTAWTAPTDVTSVEVLVVAGGGAGGYEGGGGAGGLIYNNSYSVTPGLTYTVTVGAGGVGTTETGPPATAASGSNSVFGSLTAIGGGGSGNYSATRTGATGGSGGGAASGGSSSRSGFIAGQGFSGGLGVSNGAGGGGGAAGEGVNGVSGVGGNGGAGLSFGISGTPTFYAGGGGGAAGSGTQGTGGSGIGGNAVLNGTAGSGATNTGSGGGGWWQGGSGTAGSGGSGVVVVRYTTTAVGNTSDATTDTLTDSPTLYGHDMGLGGEVVGNYATFNPLFSNGQTYTLSNGNLTASNPSSWLAVLGTIAVSTGKWYFESYPADGVWHMTGVDQITRHTSHLGGNSSTKGVALVYDPSDTRGDISYNGGNSVYTGGSVTFNAGDIIGVALDLDNNNIKFYKNNVLQYNLSNILQAGASYTFGVSLYSGGTISGNFGQRAWAYAPPAGFNALTTKNLPRLTNSAAIAPNEYFDAVTYTGTGSARSVSGFNFAPDLLWVKDRSASAYHRLFDRVRGATNSPGIYSNSDQSEGADNLTFTSTGFSYTTDPYNTGMNVNGNLHVAWGWKAGGTAVSNTAGTLTSQVSANTASGFSIVTYTGTGTAGATVGHGLGSAPELIITKARNQTAGWYTYTTVIDGSMDYFFLNTDDAKGNSGLAVPTSSVFYNDGWSASYNMLAYCFHSVAGYSKIGTYVGNGSADGPFIYTGFKPRFVMVKCSSTAGFRWIIWDTARDPVNFATRGLSPNLAGAEVTAFDADILSNGFKLRDLEGTLNTSGDTYIYMAIAEKPFGNVNGTAR